MERKRPNRPKEATPRGTKWRGGKSKRTPNPQRPSGRPTSDSTTTGGDLSSGTRKAVSNRSEYATSDQKKEYQKAKVRIATGTIERKREVRSHADVLSPLAEANKVGAKESIDIVDDTNTKLRTMSLNCENHVTPQLQCENVRSLSNGQVEEELGQVQGPKLLEVGGVKETKHLSWAERARAASIPLHFTAKDGGLGSKEIKSPISVAVDPDRYVISEANDEGGSCLEEFEDEVVSAFSQKEFGRFEPRGMENPGNLCFVNAVLQALMACSDFCGLMSSLAKSTVDLSTFPNMLALARLSQELRQESDNAIIVGTKGRDDVKHRQHKGPDSQSAEIDNREDTFKTRPHVHSGPVHCSLIMQFVLEFMPRYRDALVPAVTQEDAHEFLQFLLDALHSEHSAHGRKKSGKDGRKDADPSCSLSQNLEEEEEHDDDDDGWLMKSGKRKVRQQEVSATSELYVTPVMTTFQGKIAVSVATASAPISQTLHPFWIIELPISSESIRSVGDALDALTASEVISGYRPTKHSPPQEATKSERILKLPNVLILHLMRFQFSGSSSKLNKFVAFDKKLVVRPSWLASGCTQRNSVYKLVATISHHGKAISSGHFTADVLQSSGKWLRCDDDNLYFVPERQVLSDRPYLLFYERIDA